jgi:RecG-like helicase
VRQSGIPDLVFADIVRDASILHQAKEIAAELHQEDPSLSSPDHAGIRRFLEMRTTADDGGYPAPSSGD